TAGCSDAPAAGDGPNLLLVTIDTVRTDRLGAYGYESANTPVLDALAERGVLFEEAYSPAPMTLPVHTSLMTGVLPPEHGARVNGMHKLAEGVPTLAQHLSSEGYRTGAFVAAFVLDSRFGLDRGFDVYDDDLTEAYEQEVTEGLSSYRPGSVVVDTALDWLGESESDQPFFAWVHLYDAHFPWHPHGEGVQDESAETGSYDGEVAYVDEQVGRLVEYLRAQGLEEDTVIVALADHGEGLGDHHEIEHAYLLNEEVLHVPWIVSGPGVSAGHRVPSLVALEDFQPTALELLG
ncbi:MAG: sulfatase, partial [bacterium]|nr:sulfatase [bacterium]